MRISTFIWSCLHLHIVVSTNTVSYNDWYNKVWTKWKKVGYVSDKSYKCPRKQTFGKKGIIDSPNYPLQYPSNADCTWVIETPKEYTEIRLRFVQFNVENVKWSKLCFKDTLEVFQYADQNREKKGRYCGKNPGKEVTVYGNKAELRFKTNGYRNKRGFRIEWEAVKGYGGTFTNQTEGVINLVPNSHNTEKLFFSQWKIETPIHHNKIMLNIEQLQLPSSKQNKDCRKTFVHIIDEHNQILAEYCNTLDAPKSIRIHGKFVIVKMKVNKKTRRTIFKANWRTSSKKRKQMNYQCGRPFVTDENMMMRKDENNGMNTEQQQQQQHHSRTRRLVGGTPVQRGEWPWIVQVRVTVLSKYYTIQTITCGGVLVSPSHVITAAHCVQRTKEQVIQYEILLGAITEDHPSQQSVTVEAEHITVHPHFAINIRTGKPRNDIAIIRLPHTLEFGYDVQPICLPTKEDKKDKNCHFAGWGKTSENSLHSSRVNSIEARLWGHCDRSPSVICATYDGKNTGACKGDSGSPLICTRKNGSKYLVGILSYGGKTCPSIVDGHIDIKYYLDWLHNTMENNINT